MTGRRWLNDLGTAALVVGLLAATYLLPPDTSLKMVRDRGVLRVCIPDAYPPLVTVDSDAPGIDVKILRTVAERLDVRLQTIENPAIARTFDPRSWRVTRAQCQVVGGGVVASRSTRSFMETTEPHLATGWAILAPDLAAAPRLGAARVGFLPGATGLDRIALSSYLRDVGVTVTLMPTLDAAVAALRDGEVDALVSEALQARSLAGANGWTSAYLPEPIERHAIAFGLWKGDLTLKRAIARELSSMRATGEIDAIVAAYELASIHDGCPVCP